MGKRARPLLGVRWAELWELPLEEVRARLDIEVVAPPRLAERTADHTRERRPEALTESAA
jgi:hypothetical protein